MSSGSHSPACSGPTSSGPRRDLRNQPADKGIPRVKKAYRRVNKILVESRSAIKPIISLPLVRKGVYFALRAHSHLAASHLGRDQIIEALWPETDPGKGYENFKFQLRVIRRHLRSDSAPTEKFIEQTDDVYRPSPEAFEVDVWEFDRLIGEAAEGDGAETLKSATSLYRGEVLRAVYYSWAERMQRYFSDRFLDALVRLSDERLEQKDDVGALGALRQAIDANPHSEYLYRRTMEIYGRLGRANDIRRTYSELEATLAEIEAEPDYETAELRRRLLDELGQRPKPL